MYQQEVMWCVRFPHMISQGSDGVWSRCQRKKAVLRERECWERRIEAVGWIRKGLLTRWYIWIWIYFGDWNISSGEMPPVWGGGDTYVSVCVCVCAFALRERFNSSRIIPSEIECVCVCVCVWGRVCFIIENFLFVHESLFTIQMCSEL